MVEEPSKQQEQAEENQQRAPQEKKDQEPSSYADVLAKLSALRQNQRPLVESEQLHLIVKLMGSSETSLGVKAECLELLGHLADVPQVGAQFRRNSGAILCAIPRSHSEPPPPSSCSACRSSSPTASSAR